MSYIGEIFRFVHVAFGAIGLFAFIVFPGYLTVVTFVIVRYGMQVLRRHTRQRRSCSLSE